MVSLKDFSFLILSLVLFAPMACTTHGTESGRLENLHVEAVAFLDSINWSDKVGDTTQSYSLGGGLSGHVVFLLNLYNWKGDGAYLQRARGLGNKIVNYAKDLDSLEITPGTFTLYQEVCGSLFALTELHKATNDDIYKNAAHTYLNFILSHRDSAGTWTVGNDVLFGAAGTGLALIYANENLDGAETLQDANQVGRTLMERAIKSDSGYNWTKSQGDEFYLPNFSHGTAGIGYFLAELYSRSQDSVFLSGATKAYQFLESINAADSIFLLPYGVPNIGWSNQFDIGWAHGPAGVVRFCYAMYKITNEEKYLRDMDRCYRALKASGINGQPNPIFGYEVFPADMRFGLSGVGDFLVEYYKISKKKEVLEFSRAVCDTIINRSQAKNDKLYWPIPPYGFMRTKEPYLIYSGYFYGSTGMLYPLMNLSSLDNDFRLIKFPDNPFPD